MKTTLLVSAFMLACHFGHSQTLVGTWQLTEEKTCLEIEMKESDTETELLKDMKSSANAVARTLKFDRKGKGEEGVFEQGRKKGSDVHAFTFRYEENKIAFLDPKSGIMTRQWIVDELTASTLRMHNAARDCESKVFTRIK